MSTEVFVQDYTEKAIAVFGNTKPYMEDIKNAGGKYNHNLKYNGTTSPGWVFPKTKLASVKQLVAKINEGKITPSEPSEQKEYKPNKIEKKDQPTNDKNVVISKDEFIYIMKTLTRLEQEVAELKNKVSGNKIEHYIKKTSTQKEHKDQKKVINKEESSDDDKQDDDEDDEDDVDNEQDDDEDDEDDDDDDEQTNKINKNVKVVTVSKGPSLLRKK